MRRLLVPLVEGAARAIDMSATAFVQRRTRSVADLRRKAHRITARAVPSEAEHAGISSSSSNKLFVGSLPFEMTDKDLADTFATFGEVVSVAIIMDRATGRSKGFGFVEMVNITETTIQSLDGTEIWGRRLTVRKARPKTESVRDFTRESVQTPPERIRPEALRPRAADIRPQPLQPPTEPTAHDARPMQPPTEPTAHDARPMLEPINVWRVLPGTEMDREAEEALSGVGG
jgi:cold-inducible RNA-binding protein